MSISKDSQKAPNLRFKGFTDDWEQRKLGNSVRFINGRAYSQAELLDKGKYRVLRVGNFNTNTSWYYSDLELEDDKYANKGDLLYLWATSFGPEIWEQERVIYHYHIWKIEILDENIDKQYLYSWLETDKERIKQMTNGTTMVHVTKGLIEERSFQFPIYKQEQVKIGTFLKQIDNTITLHQRKLDQLNQLKEALLQQMFPGKGETLPKLRFAGFEGDWEEHKLENLCITFTDGDWIESKDQSNSGVRLIQTGNIGVTEFLDKFDKAKWVSEQTFEQLNCVEVFPGDILISRLPQPAGRACILPNLGTRTITAVDCTIVRTSSEYSSNYLIQYLSTQNYFKMVNKSLAGGTRQRISRSTLAQLNVPVPFKYVEQQRIGEFFKLLDKAITLQQRKLDQLNNMKQVLLENMFI